MQSFALPASLRSNEDTQQRLLNYLRLMHLIHHRNNNQHRSSPWYRRFNAFRRELGRLCKDLGIERGPGFPASATDASKPKRGASTSRPAHTLRGATLKPSTSKTAVIQRLTHWIDSNLISRCYTAFSSLTATPSFSPLALVLLAILAGVCTLTGITTTLQALAKADEERQARHDEAALGAALEKFANEDAADLFDAFDRANHTDSALDDERRRRLKRRAQVEGEVNGARDDVGVPLVRDNFAPSEKQPEKPSEAIAQKRRKRVKKSNAIDDLFAGL